MPISAESKKAFEDWFAKLKKYKNNGGLPARGTIAAALVVLEHLKQDYRLDLTGHQAAGMAQLKGVNPKALQKILSDFGELRVFSTEGGRTNRGAPGEIKLFLEMLATLRLDSRSTESRNEILNELQELLVEKVREHHNRKRLEITYDAGRTTWSGVHDLLRQAVDVCKAGPVAQYLVGAKLQLRFPDMQVSNQRYSAADIQSGRCGDFQIGDTAFHVTVSPMPGLYEKCRTNISSGLRVFVLVPDSSVVGARQNAEAIAPGKIAVESIESFIGNNIEELSLFKKDKLTSGFRRLLDTYNTRVDEIEADKSLMIQIPPTLL